MGEDAPQIDVRAVQPSDAAAIHRLDYSFETDRIYTLRVEGRLLGESAASETGEPALAFTLIETAVDLPLYKNFHEFGSTLAYVRATLACAEGGYVALADGEVVGLILLNVEEKRSVARVEQVIVSRHFRRYGVGSLLLNCASDWARKRGCWALVLETQNVNYPAIQFYLRNGLEVWSISQNFYPPGPVEHEVAVFMGKRLWPAP